MSIEIEINDIKFGNPTMNAAGVLGTTASSLKRIAESGAGGVVTKSISLNSKEGNEGPVLVETDYGVLNSMGLPNPGAENYKNELKKLQKLKKPIICSVFGETPKKAKRVVKKLNNFVDVFELNLSCPNVDEEIISSNCDLIEEYVGEVSSETKKPVWTKLGGSSCDIVDASKTAVESGADSIVLINTIKGMLIDIESGAPILGNKVGGLSGKAIHPIAVEQVFEVYKELNKPIIGVGGISNYEEAIEMIMAGAKGIQIGTALKNDLNLFKKINKNLRAYLNEKNLSDLSEIHGIAN